MGNMLRSERWFAVLALSAALAAFGSAVWPELRAAVLTNASGFPLDMPTWATCSECGGRDAALWTLRREPGQAHPRGFYQCLKCGGQTSFRDGLHPACR